MNSKQTAVMKQNVVNKNMATNTGKHMQLSVTLHPMRSLGVSLTQSSTECLLRI